MPLKLSLCSLVLLLALPATAQTITPAQNRAADAADAAEQPVTDTLNADAATQASDNRVAVATANATNEAQYAADIAAYRASVEASRQAVAADQVRYGQQQRAYADAMAAWRDQARACEKGRMKACKAPTPNPADFY